MPFKINVDYLLAFQKTLPMTLIEIIVSLLEPLTTILGGPELFINMGSTINLTCVVQHSPEPPPAIRWTHNDEVS